MSGGRRGLCDRNAAGDPDVHIGYGKGLRMRHGWSNRTGAGRKIGRGRGVGGYPSTYGYGTPLNEKAELEMLKADAREMKHSIDAIHERIEMLEKGQTE